MAGAILQMLLASAGAGLAAGQGSFSATEGADASAFTGQLVIQGVLAATEDADLGAFESPLIVEGTIAATEGSDTAAFQGPATWTPAADTDLFIWYKGSDLSGTNGDTVATWPDAAGSNDATSGTVTLDTTGLNGFNVVNGAAASTQKILIPNVFSGVLTEGSSFAVVKANADPAASVATSGGFLWNSSGDHNTSAQVYPSTGGQIFDGTGCTQRRISAVNPTPSLDQWHIVCTQSASADYRHNLNGTQVGQTGTNTVGWSTTPNLFQGSSIAYYDGKIAEIFFLDTHGELSLKKAEGYLAHRFAITSVLPTNHPYKTTAPQVGTSYATLDGIETNATLSNGNLTADHSNTTLGGARSTSYRKSGKFYFEVTCTDIEVAADCIGILTSAGTYTNLVTNGTNCAKVRQSGAIWGNNADTTKTLGALADADIIGVAVDLDNDKVWFRKAPSGDWQGEAIGSQNPATNTGGASVSSYTASVLAPAVGFSTDADTAFTLNAGQSAFSGTAPSGFTSGWPE